MAASKASQLVDCWVDQMVASKAALKVEMKACESAAATVGKRVCMRAVWKAVKQVATWADRMVAVTAVSMAGN